MKTSMILCVMTFLLSISFGSFADVNKDIETAKKAGKCIYLVVTDKNAMGTEDLIKLAESAQKTAKKTSVIKVDRDDKANESIITKYRLAGIPLPIILVIAPNGVVSGSLTKQDATTENLIKYLPTPKQAEILQGFENGKAALIICTKKEFKDKAALSIECDKAIKSIDNKALKVLIDVNSKEEQNFLDLIKPDKNKTTLLVFTGSGQFSSTLESSAKSDDIVKAVNKKAGGCCPPGSSKSGCGSSKASGCDKK